MPRPAAFCAATLVAVVLALPVAARAANEQVQSDLSLLADRSVVDATDYWMEHAVAEGKCDGQRTANLLVQLAKAFKPADETQAAIAVLVERHVINSPEYWTKHAVVGGVCDGANVAAVVRHVVERLPIASPRPISAAPIEPTPASALKPCYDVIVAGAGMGGCGAAIQAARMGRSVLLLDETDWIGGQMNAAAVTSMDEGVTLCRERGLYRELCALIAAHYQPLGIHPETAYWHNHFCVEPRVGRNLLGAMLADARGQGVLDLALRAHVTKVVKTGDKVTGVEIEAAADGGKTTRSIQSKILIDATEWGDVLPLSGARYRVGNCTSDSINPKQRVQSNTWTAVVKQYPAGTPHELLITAAPPGYTDKVHEGFVRSLVLGDDKIDTKAHPWNFASFIGYRGMPDSSRTGDSPPITRTHLNFNNDYRSTVAEIENPTQRKATDREMRLKTLQLIYYIQHTLGKTDWSVANDEGFDSPYNRAEIDEWLAERRDLEPYRAVLYHFSVIPYTRESRRIIGLHTLTAGEIERKPRSPALFPDVVALGDYAVDLHESMNPPYLELDLDHEADIPQSFGERGVGPFAIPFGSLIPEKVDGFLPAEKNFSQSRMANGATRLQPHTLLVGQAVGAIAALAIERQIQPRDLDSALVQCVLLDAGDTLFVTPISDIRHDGPDFKPAQLTLARDLLVADKGRFRPLDPFTPADVQHALTQLFGDSARVSESSSVAVTGATLAQAITAWLARSPRPFEFHPQIVDASKPLTRIDAARVLTQFLEQRTTIKIGTAIQ